MSPGLQMFLSCALTFGVPLAFAIREILVTRRRPPPPGSWRPEPPPALPPPPKPGGGRAHVGPLPACLIPARLGPVRPLGTSPARPDAPVRVPSRVLEPVG